MKKKMIPCLSVAVGFLVFSIAPAFGLQYDFNSGYQDWVYATTNDTAATVPPTPWDPSGFLSASVPITVPTSAADRPYLFRTSGIAGSSGLDFTGMSITLDFRAPGGGTIYAQGGSPLVRVALYGSNGAVYVSDDAHSWNPNSDDLWTTHTVNLVAANFTNWPWVPDVGFNSVLQHVTYVGLVFTASDLSPLRPELGFYANPQPINIQVDNFNVAAVPEPATMFLLGSGLIGVGAFVRRRFKK